MNDALAMAEALAEARLAQAQGDVPVGAVVVYRGGVIARGHNRRELDRDPLAHAEILALRAAAAALGRWRLSGCSLVVTLEPCPMCAGALVHARVNRVVFGATDPRTGACGSIMNLAQDQRLNHRVEVSGGVEAETCSALLKSFFKGRRAGARETLGADIQNSEVPVDDSDR